MGMKVMFSGLNPTFLEYTKISDLISSYLFSGAFLQELFVPESNLLIATTNLKGRSNQIIVIGGG